VFYGFPEQIERAVITGRDFICRHIVSAGLNAVFDTRDINVRVVRRDEIQIISIAAPDVHSQEYVALNVQLLVRSAQAAQLYNAAISLKECFWQNDFRLDIKINFGLRSLIAVLRLAWTFVRFTTRTFFKNGKSSFRSRRAGIFFVYFSQEAEGQRFIVK